MKPDSVLLFLHVRHAGIYLKLQVAFAGSISFFDHPAFREILKSNNSGAPIRMAPYDHAVHHLRIIITGWYI